MVNKLSASFLQENQLLKSNELSSTKSSLLDKWDLLDEKPNKKRKSPGKKEEKNLPYFECCH